MIRPNIHIISRVQAKDAQWQTKRSLPLAHAVFIDQARFLHGFFNFQKQPRSRHSFQVCEEATGTFSILSAPPGGKARDNGAIHDIPLTPPAPCTPVPLTDRQLFFSAPAPWAEAF
jgi:hypothetical protein